MQPHSQKLTYKAQVSTLLYILVHTQTQHLHTEKPEKKLLGWLRKPKVTEKRLLKVPVILLLLWLIANSFLLKVN